MTKKALILSGIVILLSISIIFPKFSDSEDNQPSSRSFQKSTSPQAGLPYTQEKYHDVGNLYLTVTNWGFFGSQRGDDTPLYCITDETGECLPSAEYPGGSGIEYLFQGALWMGAVVEGDTLVSLGTDGWISNWNQFYPGSDETEDKIHELSIEPSIADSSATIHGRTFQARSQQDYIAMFTDTLTNTDYVPPEHKTRGIKGIKVIQKSYAWSYNYAKNFVFIDYELKNIKDRALEDFYMGIYIDGDCGHISTPAYAQDDINGFKEYYVNPNTGDTTKINAAWLADNDGDPSGGEYTEESPTGALGAVVLNPSSYLPSDTGLNYSFNWWISNTDEKLDWGPYLEENDEGWDGTPSGLTKKYQVMSNGEFDFGQYEILDYFEGDNDWVWDDITEERAANLQNGYDTRFLLSFGPLFLPPGGKDTVTIAFFVAEDFHVNPLNTGSDLDYEEYSFRNLARTAKWCIDVYDNPGVDTDTTDGKKPDIKTTPSGDTVRVYGDGVPDYQGPIPPPAPEFTYETKNNKVILRWEDEVEDIVDPITQMQDFEGYRVYVSETKLARDFVRLSSWDKRDFNAKDSLGNQFDKIGDVMIPEGVEENDTFLINDSTDTCRYEVVSGDTIYYKNGDSLTIVGKYKHNTGLPPKDANGKYYFEVDSLRAGRTLYFSVVAFDHGMPSRGLTSLESSIKNNAKKVVPQGEAAREDEPYVIPNPYRMDKNYYKMKWEEGTTPYDRKIKFMNLPETCTIRIFTLDGDLVEKIEHDSGASEVWNLISRNNQSIVSGIYMFSVEDEEGNISMGKFVIL